MLRFDENSATNSLQFNTKTKDQLFCGKCGASIGIDFRERNPLGYGISVSTKPGPRASHIIDTPLRFAL